MTASKLSDAEAAAIVAAVASELWQAWNAADGDRYGRPFAEDADFVNIRGDQHRSRTAIARGHQAIFDTIYKGSELRGEVADARSIAPGVIVGHVRHVLKAPSGPLAGEHASIATLVLVEHGGGWKIAAFHNTLVGKV